jgi:hypothetical protein
MKKWLKILIPLVVIAGAIIWLVLWMRAPSDGNVTFKQVNNSNSSTALQEKQLNGQHISFKYSGKYVQSANTPANNDVERYTLSAGTNYDKRIEVAVVNLPNGQLSSNGDYIYRQKTPSVYTKRLQQTAIGQFEIWVKADGSEQTAMIPRGDKAIVLSFLTNTGAEASLTGEVDTLLKTVVWKQ